MEEDRLYPLQPQLLSLIHIFGLCGADSRFDRAFMAWIGDGAAKSLSEVADERRRRHADTSPSA